MGLPLISSLMILIISARIMGQIFIKLKQPAIVGEMLAGILLGPAVFGIVEFTPALKGISELAVFLIILQAGLEMNAKDILNSMKGRGLAVAALGFFIPFLAGITIGIFFNLDIMRTVFLGICISITALPVAIRILEQFNILNSDIGKYSVSTAVLNDLTALLILGVILALPNQSTLENLLQSVSTISLKFLFLAGSILFLYSFLRKLEKRGVKAYKYFEKIVQILGPEALFGFMIIFVLMFSSLSELLGFHAIIGAFFGALLIDRKFFLPQRFSQINNTLGSVSNGFLAPIFFASLGLDFTLSAMSSWGFIVIVLVASIVSKIIAGYLGGKILGMPNREAIGLGVILNGRGVMELVVASIAYQRGFIGQGMYTTLMIMGIVTTVITPILFQYFTYKTPVLNPPPTQPSI